MLRTIQWTVLLGIVATTLLLGLARVSAHADYERSEPGRNEVLPEQPDRVDVFFTQEVLKQEGLNHVRVFDEQETQVSAGDGVVDDDDRTHIYAELLSNLSPGRYIVSWMTTSFDDGEPDDGAFCFYVGVEPTAEQSAECRALDEEQGLTPKPTVAGPEATDTPAPTPTVVPVTPTEAAPTPDEASDDDDDGSSTGIIIGVVIGIVVLVVVVGGAAVWLRRRQE